MLVSPVVMPAEGDARWKFKTQAEPIADLDDGVAAEVTTTEDGAKAEESEITVNGAPEPPPSAEVESAVNTGDIQPDGGTDSVSETGSSGADSPSTDVMAKEAQDESVPEEQADKSAEALVDEQLQQEIEASQQTGIKPRSILDRQLARDLDQQYRALNEALQVEDSFSPIIGEHYFGYGMLLKRAGRMEEAREAFATALHIEKVNNGIYSLEQRPALKALFETYFALGNVEKYEDYLGRIIWVENQHGGPIDDFAFDMLVQVGNTYLDRYLARPIAGELGVSYLQNANRYLSYAVERYGDVPLSEKLMPYGELALVNTLESKLIARVDTSALYDQSRQRRPTNFETERQVSYLSKSFNRGEFFLKEYLNKAQRENHANHIVTALMNLGDINLLFQRRQAAAKYYEMAWLEAQKLPEGHELRDGLEEPVQLPAYQYTQPRDYVATSRPTRLVPLTFEIDKYGKPSGVVPIDESDENARYFSKAKRALRKLTFRPAIIDGKMVDSELVDHKVRINVSKQENT